MRSKHRLQIAIFIAVVSYLMPMTTSARFISVDPKANQLPSMSPYAYTRNNPIKNIDPDGQLDIPANQQQKYPRLTAYVKNNIRNVANVPKISNALQKNGEFSSQSLNSALTWGQGPSINVTPLTGANGSFSPNQGSNVLNINATIVQQFENATGSAAAAAQLLVGSTILHELTHFGDDQDGQDRPGEEGTQFEVDAYGQDIDNTSQAQTVINNLKKKKQQKQQQQQQQKKPPTP